MARKRKAPKSFSKKLEVSEALAEVIGVDKAARSEVTSRLWKYIKKHDLQKCDEPRIIEPDACLARVIGRKPIDMFKMTAAVSKHIFAD